MRSAERGGAVEAALRVLGAHAEVHRHRRARLRHGDHALVPEAARRIGDAQRRRRALELHGEAREEHGAHHHVRSAHVRSLLRAHAADARERLVQRGRELARDGVRVAAVRQRRLHGGPELARARLGCFRAPSRRMLRRLLRRLVRRTPERRRGAPRLGLRVLLARLAELVDARVAQLAFAAQLKRELLDERVGGDGGADGSRHLLRRRPHRERHLRARVRVFHGHGAAAAHRRRGWEVVRRVQSRRRQSVQRRAVRRLANGKHQARLRRHFCGRVLRAEVSFLFLRRRRTLALEQLVLRLVPRLRALAAAAPARLGALHPKPLRLRLPLRRRFRFRRSPPSAAVETSAHRDVSARAPRSAATASHSRSTSTASSPATTTSATKLNSRRSISTSRSASTSPFQKGASSDVSARARQRLLRLARLLRRALRVGRRHGVGRRRHSHQHLPGRARGRDERRGRRGRRVWRRRHRRRWRRNVRVGPHRRRRVFVPARRAARLPSCR